MLTKLFTILLTTTIAGCANSPVYLGKVSPPVNIITTYSNYPIYNAIDKFSFSQAEIKYPASRGHHTIQVGDYLFSKLLELMKQSSASLVRLNEFYSQCDFSSNFMPTAICKTKYSISIVENNSERVISSQLPDIDIGHVRVREDQFTGFVNGDDFFQNRIKPILESVVQDFAKKQGRIE